MLTIYLQFKTIDRLFLEDKIIDGFKIKIRDVSNNCLKFP